MFQYFYSRFYLIINGIYRFDLIHSRCRQISEFIVIFIKIQNLIYDIVHIMLNDDKFLIIYKVVLVHIKFICSKHGDSMASGLDDGSCRKTIKRAF